MGAIQWFQGEIEREVGPIVMTASRLDVSADFQNWELCAEDQVRFIYRVDGIVTRENERTFTGFEFGRRKTNTVVYRIYDKIVQIQQLGIGYWPDFWGAKYDPNQRVLRVEFEINRTGLGQFGADSPFDAIEKTAGIWLGVTNDWLTLRTPSGDATRSHWPIESSWEDIQRASFVSGAFGIKRMYDGRKRGELARLLPGARGFISSIGAAASVRTLNEDLDVAWKLIREEEAKGTESFESRTSRQFAQRESP